MKWSAERKTKLFTSSWHGAGQRIMRCFKGRSIAYLTGHQDQTRRSNIGQTTSPKVATSCAARGSYGAGVQSVLILVA
jgi:hypothetical protein